MTAALTAKEIVSQLGEKFPGAVEEAGPDSALVKSESLLAVVEYLQTAEGLKFGYLNYITAVDYYSYFERIFTRDNPTVPSLSGLYQGADWQEREVYDLMGIIFKGHPNLKRVFLWEGYDGHPLRKDFNR